MLPALLLCAAPAFSQDEVSKAPPRPSLRAPEAILLLAELKQKKGD